MQIVQGSVASNMFKVVENMAKVMLLLCNVTAESNSERILTIAHLLPQLLTVTQSVSVCYITELTRLREDSTCNATKF